MDDVITTLRRWRDDPVVFVREALQAEPSGQQAQALRAFAAPGARVAIKSGHGTGKSTLMSWLILWALTVHADVKCPVTAPTAHQLSDVLWAEIRKWGSRLPSLWRDALEVTADTVRYNGCAGYAVARTGRKENPEALQGFHAETLCFFCDEASGIDDVVFQVAQGALSTEGARIIMAANPTRTSGYFFRAFHADRDRWQRFTFSCLDSPHVSPDYAREVAESYGEDSDIYRVRVLGKFPGASDLQFIGRDVIETAMGRHLRQEEYEFAPVIIGVDVARFGDDRTVAVKRQGLRADVIWTARKADTMQIADRVVTLAQMHKADAIMVDSTGVGAGVVDRLRQLGHRPVGVDSAAASSLDNCQNKRAEMWWRMRDWMRDGGAIPAIEALMDDLSGPEYAYNTRGKVQLEKKADMKKRGLASPDMADALAMTFAYPVVKQSEQGLWPEMADSSYDVFSI